MDQDPELKAMGTISNAIENLDEAQRSRVLQWVCARFDISVARGSNGRSGTGGGIEPEGDPDDGRGGSDQDFESFADLYNQANPSTNPDRALIGGYWLQVGKGDADFASQTVNAELKDLGHGISNITHALTSLITSKPRLVIQVRKSGSSKQARKKYKLTQEGVKRVNNMVNSQ